MELEGMAESARLKAERHAALTARVLRMLNDPECGGPAAVSRALGVSPKTVETIYTKAGMRFHPGTKARLA
jgi:hypothetical protein